MNEQVDIEVGRGPVTTASIWTSVSSGLVALAGFLTTITGSLPEGVDPAAGFYLAIGAGVVSTLAQLVAGLSRAKFAEAKAQVMAGQSGYGVFLDSLLDPEVAEDPEEPTDTNVTPPIEPQN